MRGREKERERERERERKKELGREGERERGREREIQYNILVSQYIQVVGMLFLSVFELTMAGIQQV